MDPDNKNNFHNYFDGKENLLLLLKTLTGAVVGGYTRFPYNKKETQKPGEGFIFSLTSEKVFLRKKEPKTAVAPYDDQFLLFGNAELRIKTNINKIFSNLAIGTSTFEAEGFSRSEFLGLEKENEVEM